MGFSLEMQGTRERRRGLEPDLVNMRVAVTQQRRNETGLSTSADLSQKLPLEFSATCSEVGWESVLYGSVPSTGLTTQWGVSRFVAE